jgi:hypothetical protein
MLSIRHTDREINAGNSEKFHNWAICDHLFPFYWEAMFGLALASMVPPSIPPESIDSRTQWLA